METIRGRRSLDLDLTELNARLTNYNRVVLDLGTGDGRYVHALAERNPCWFVIGIDACRENLCEHSRAKLPNMLFVIASAQRLPCELNGLASHITINFPWGSLLESLLAGDSNLMCGLESISRATTTMDIHLNGGALAEAGTTLESGAIKIHSNMLKAGWQLKDPALMNTCALQKYPTTWARRLAHGRDPRAMSLSGYLACGS
jgi:16S rRNA (adenine(1408)-N(1))-methyltransferase